jgi:hypothetical protein
MSDVRPHPTRIRTAARSALICAAHAPDESILRDQWLAFAVATAGIGLMMVVALRGRVCLVCGAERLPVLVVTPMGWLG